MGKIILNPTPTKNKTTNIPLHLIIISKTLDYFKKKTLINNPETNPTKNPRTMI